MKIERLRKFNTRDVYPGGRHDNDMCMTVRAGNRIYLRGQTGLDLDHRLRDPADPAAQAHQAMENAKDAARGGGIEPRPRHHGHHLSHRSGATGCRSTGPWPSTCAETTRSAPGSSSRVSRCRSSRWSSTWRR